MPIKWTPENNQTVQILHPSRQSQLLITFQLLLKILETSDVSPNVKAISEAWPAAEGEEAPTPRAIQEQLKKIRAMNKGTGSLKIVGARGAGAQTSSAKPSPAKPATPKKSNANGGSPNKRKKPSADDDESNTPENGLKSDPHAFEPESESPTKKSKVKAANGIKAEPGLSMDGAFDAYFSMPGEV
ncbi:MAG: hypothetical protein Q9204_005895 [Flavoplaca sp. TL-2023a]